MIPDLSANRVLRVTARFLQIVVALVFIVAAGLKAFDPAAFSEQIASYGIFPGLSLVAAWCFIIGEFLLAAALLVNALPRLAPVLGIVLLAFFIGITMYGMAIGLNDSCGCFGNLVHRTPEQVIIEDALMILALLFSLLVFARHKVRTPIWKWLVCIAVGAGAAGVTATSAALPVDDFVTSLKPGSTFSSWPTEGLYRNLNTGTSLVFLFSLQSASIETDIAMMNTLAQNDQLPTCVGLIVDGASSLTTLTFQYAPSFAAGAVEPRFARALYRRLPRAFLIQDGVVRDTWSRIPVPQEVSLVMARYRIPAPEQR